MARLPQKPQKNKKKDLGLRESSKPFNFMYIGFLNSLIIFDFPAKEQSHRNK